MILGYFLNHLIYIFIIVVYISYLLYIILALLFSLFFGPQEIYKQDYQYYYNCYFILIDCFHHVCETTQDLFLIIEMIFQTFIPKPLKQISMYQMYCQNLKNDENSFYSLGYAIIFNYTIYNIFYSYFTLNKFYYFL